MILFALLACHAPEPDVAPVASLADRVRWESVAQAAEFPVATLPAEIVPAPRSSVSLGPPASGRIVRWLVAPGDAVVEGQPVAEMSSPELAGVGARVRQLSSRVSDLQRAATMAEQAAARGVISQREAQSAQADLSQAQASLQAARSELAAYDAEAGDAGFAWRAPVSGIAGEVLCAVGTVAAHQPCLTVQHDQAVLLNVRVPERYLALIAQRTTADFTSQSGVQAHFVETQRSPAVDRDTRSVLLQYVTTDSQPLAGTSGRATVRAPAAPGLQQVPVSALTRLEGMPTVFVQGSEGPEARSVRVHSQDADVAVIEGLEPDAQVAVAGVFLLKSMATLEAQ